MDNYKCAHFNLLLAASYAHLGIHFSFVAINQTIQFFNIGYAIMLMHDDHDYIYDYIYIYIQ